MSMLTVVRVTIAVTAMMVGIATDVLAKMNNCHFYDSYQKIS